MEFFGKTKIDFLNKRKFFFFLSIALNVVGLGLAAFGIRMGIDFKGGSEVAVSFTNPQQTAVIRDIVAKAGFQNAEIKSYGKPTDFLIRVSDVAVTGHEKPSATIISSLQKAFPNEKITVQKDDLIGPKVGSELRNKALLALIIAVIAILIYIAFRFEFIYGLGAVIALIHDVCISFGMVIIFQKLEILNLEFNMGVLAALLTVAGFSINDTVIIFDRIRENRVRHKGLSLISLMNLSINETLSRTINTVVTVILVLVTILVLGGEALHGFAFTMLVGIITGTYSSIYIASAFVVWFLETVRKEDLETPYQKELAASRA